MFRTEKSNKKRNIRSADDLSLRSRAIYQELSTVVRTCKPDMLAIEACALPFGKSRSSVLSALGRVRGLVDALSSEHSLAIVEFTPQEVKQLIAGDKKATKEQVQWGVERRVPGIENMWPERKAMVEHAADAVAVALCALDTDLARALLRLPQGASV